MKVIVTSGATREPIDSVRFISNFSSGRTGAAVCEALAARGAEVIQVHGVESVVAGSAARREMFTDHASLDSILRRLLGDPAHEAVIHAAAVGDFSVAGARPAAKLDSGRELVVRLRPTHKIIDRIRSYAGNRDLLLIGFKLTHDPDPESRSRAARELRRRSGANYVVQNDIATLAIGEDHVFVIHGGDGSAPRSCAGRSELAAALTALVEEHRARSDS